ncbi:hypothetical protein NE237_011329 [Protea cynaroides]|uniref:Uncharacterized protein n=1 Tax=Protea cynaroides TaxID=273540 RepID=A0A9Q0GUR2_9MAGN|nr:hypothetical protein NE237_011329 [Protea cynaroides]
MAFSVGRTTVAPLLIANLIMYIIVVGFASWCLNRFINGQTNNPGFGGNSATMFFLIFAILAGVVGVASKFAGGNHIRVWRNDSLAAAISSSLVAWAITALAFGFACKEIHIGGYRGWRLKVLEAFIIILTFTKFSYLVLLHAGIFNSSYGPGYRDPDYAGGAPGTEPGHKSGTGVRVNLCSSFTPDFGCLYQSAAPCSSSSDATHVAQSSRGRGDVSAGGDGGCMSVVTVGVSGRTVFRRLLHLTVGGFIAPLQKYLVPIFPVA